MQYSDQPGRTRRADSLKAALSILGFGLILLALLIAIDRPQWFVLRPASGTAAAMAKASEPPASAQQRAVRDQTP